MRGGIGVSSLLLITVISYTLLFTGLASRAYSEPSDEKKNVWTGIFEGSSVGESMVGSKKESLFKTESSGQFFFEPGWGFPEFFKGNGTAALTVDFTNFDVFRTVYFNQSRETSEEICCLVQQVPKKVKQILNFSKFVMTIK